MKSKSLILLAVAAGCGLVAMLGVQQMLSGGRTPAQTKVKILVAKSDIDPGIPLDKTNVGFKEWPKDALPEEAVTKEEDYTERSLKHRVGPGQPILLTELGKKGDFGLEVQIPEGMTVVTYPATATMTHSGLLKPGSFVDVYASLEYPQKGGGKKTEVKPVLQCIQVIAVGNQVAGTEAASEGTAKDAKNVSFVAYPLQGQLLQLAYKKSNGAIQLAMRSRNDKSLTNTRDLTEQALSSMQNTLFGETEESKPTHSETAKAKAKPKSSFNSFIKRPTSSAVAEVGDQATRRTWKIEVFQGDQKEVQEIDWPEEPAANTTPSSTNAKQGWSSPLMQFFSGRPKGETESSDSKNSTTESKRPVEPRASSFVRRLPEAAPAENNNAQP
ncbi:MAG: Flp pilus assembly protein CpaB [Candidatus Saccharimonas sp.]|nr:Flp pilus assembly protein CpaB [Planctomycetaceae bacterium]